MRWRRRAGAFVMTGFRPADGAEAEQVVAWAAAEGEALEIVGGGSKRGLGRPVRAPHVLELGAIAGILDYEPAELVLTARAGTTMAAIGTALDAAGQMLAFEPPVSGGLFAGAGSPTLGGVLACNLAGPRRIRAGAARDHFLGFRAVNGWGDGWKAGGRVVKNVTGYDMGKLQAGAFGTLSVLLELSLKVLPRPETSASVLLTGDDPAAAVAAMATALNSPHEVSAAAHLPAAAAARSAVGAVAGAGRGVTALRIEGPGPSVAFRRAALAELLGAAGSIAEAESATLWTEIAEVVPLLADAPLLWRLCPPPAAAPALLEGLHAALAGRCLLDWGGGLVWFAPDPAAAGADGGAGRVRAALAQTGGHAMLFRAPEEMRAAAGVFDPLAGPLAGLTRRIKAGFDPRGILNPGRMHEGI